MCGGGGGGGGATHSHTVQLLVHLLYESVCVCVSVCVIATTHSNGFQL